MKPILLDSDILIDFLRGRQEAISFVFSRLDRIFLSAIVVTELFAGVKGEEEQE